jgi:hypothetical protein
VDAPGEREGGQEREDAVVHEFWGRMMADGAGEAIPKIFRAGGVIPFSYSFSFSLVSLLFVFPLYLYFIFIPDHT